jgi:hypothetical protein
MTVTPGALAMRSLQPADEPAVLRLLYSALAGGPTGERTAEFFRWKHLDNPFGTSIALGMEHEGELIGLRLVMRWAFRSGNTRIAAGRMVDTATHPHYRGLGIFRDLTMASLELARRDTDVIFNTPNANSRPGYLKMGWNEVGVMATSVSPVRPLRLAHRARSALKRSEYAQATSVACPLPRIRDVFGSHEDDIAELLDARLSIAGGRLVTDADRAYFRWRFVDAPGLDYRAIPVLQGGRLRGLGIGRIRGRSGLREFTLGEVLSAPGDTVGTRSVLRAARRARTDHVATHLPRHCTPGRTLPASGYLTSGRVGLTLTTLPLRALPVNAVSPSSWSLSLGDLEVF